MERPEPNKAPRSLAEKLAACGHACEIPFTHDRLQEMHYWWHQMARNYHEPDPFRYSLGAFVQAGRSVSFMLQKEQATFDDFSWYQSWVEEAKKDQVLCWMHDARTDIVHRQALQPRSWLEMRCIDNPRDPTDEDDSPIGTQDPFKCTHYYILSGPSTDHTHEFTRLWETEGLPGRELLEACADIYDRLDQLVGRAHQHLGGGMTSYRQQESDRALPCMQDTVKFRVVHTVIRGGQEVWEGEPPGLHTR